MSTLIARLREAGVLEALDVELALSLGEAAHEREGPALLALALASAHARAGHVCVDLRGLAGMHASVEDGTSLGFDYPTLPDWQHALSTSSLVGNGDSPTPMVLAHGQKLYLRRHFQDERRLAARLSTLAAEAPPAPDTTVLAALARRMFGDGKGHDRQKLAAELAVLSRLCIITGGPGTGKTTTVAAILALLSAEAQARGAGLRALLLAPTGKAASRLAEAVGRAVTELDCPRDVLAMIPTDARTIHRGLEAGRSGFRIDQERPFLADVVVVDEASMVDLGLMRRLVDGIPRAGRLVLLGDPHQLASVEAGAVLSDVIGAEQEPRYSPTLARRLEAQFGDQLPASWVKTSATAIDDSIVRLVTSHRFAGDSPLGRLARAVQDGDVEGAMDCFQSGTEVSLVEPRGALPSASLPSFVLEGFRPVCTADSPEVALGMLTSFRVLCAHRTGPLGVSGVNELARQILVGNQLVGRTQGFQEPVMILKNDPTLDLANGDVGIVWKDASGDVRACVPRRSGHRLISVARLPPHEPAFAMSIHKSQGSEFDSVVVMLPDVKSPLLSRELLYTAVTRARVRLIVHGTREAVARAIERRVARASGLAELLGRATA